MVIAKLTNNTHETNVGSLIGRDAIFVIPFFQRPYKWMPKRLNQFEKDLLSLVDGSNDVHFLGAVIHHGLYSDPSDPDAYQVIDGQQRLTTIYLYLCAIVRAHVELGNLVEAQKIFRKYIVSAGAYNRSNIKLQSSKEDQGDMNAVIRNILATKHFEQSIEGFRFSALSNSVENSRRVSANYKLAQTFLREQIRLNGEARLGEIYTCLVQSMTLVQIDIKDPTNGPKIFDSLNSGQEPMTTGDLVRNDVFAKTAADDPDEAIRLDTHHWGPFYEKFKVGSKNFFDDYFFPFGLTHDANLKKSDVYAALKTHWENERPEDVVNELIKFQGPFLDLKFGTNSAGLQPILAARVRRFFSMGAPTSVYPFLMQLIRACQQQTVSESDAIESLDVVDSFLTRRALCGHEPTGLHAVFKGLWNEVQGAPSAGRITARIASRRTVHWPENQEVMEAVMNAPLYGTSIDRYILRQYDESLKGDDVSSLNMWIEHVLPQSYSKEWSQFTPAEHSMYKHVFANLIPLSSQMNQSIQNRGYDIKRPQIKELSAFASARRFAEEYDSWSPTFLRKRGELLAEWCVSRWPHSGKEVG